MLAGLPFAAMETAARPHLPTAAKDKKFYYDMLWDGAKNKREGRVKEALEELDKMGATWTNIAGSHKSRSLSPEALELARGSWPGPTGGQGGRRGAKRPR